MYGTSLVMVIAGSLCESFSHDCLKHLPRVIEAGAPDPAAASGLLAIIMADRVIPKHIVLEHTSYEACRLYEAVRHTTRALDRSTGPGTGTDRYRYRTSRYRWCRYLVTSH